MIACIEIPIVIGLLALAKLKGRNNSKEEYQCEKTGHFPIYDSVNNQDRCEICGGIIYQYKDEEIGNED